MRLIDADALKASLRHEYDKEYASFLNCKSDEDKPEFGAASFTWLRALVKVDFAATVDAVQVVRCGDCKHFNPDDQAAEDADWCGWCRYNGCLTDDFDFCSRGVEKDNETD